MIKIYKYGEVPTETILARTEPTANVADVVADIIEDVRNRGDKALFEYTKRFDKADLKDLAVSSEEIQEAVDATDPEFVRILKEAAENIKNYHKRQVREGFIIKEKQGIILGQRILPIEKAGLYVPGGTAAYPSTVLMDSIPAKLAGVEQLVMVTPPGPDGKLPAAILAAAYIAGVDKIYKVGGAQAIAALAYGTESVPRVDKIVGPGNAFVAEAKRQVYGQVSIDMIAGPSEILVIADGVSDAANVAADLLSQAEHDKNASAVLITDSEKLAGNVADEIEKQLRIMKREKIARASIDNNGKIIIVPDLIKAVEVSNDLAPEHLELCVDDPFELLDLVKNAGSVFMGRSCPEALGDYLGGPNHTLPTSGSARFSSPLSVDDFIKKSQFTYYTAEAFAKVAEDVAIFAEKEGLTGHARSARIRTEEKK